MEGPGGGCLRGGRRCGLGGHEHRYVPSPGARERARERALVAAVAAATAKSPSVAGKPGAALFETAARHSGVDRPIVVGDRLDTDILGGNRAGMATALVLTGVDSVRTALAARVDERPDYLIGSLGELYEEYPAGSGSTAPRTPAVGQLPLRTLLNGDHQRTRGRPRQLACRMRRMVGSPRRSDTGCRARGQLHNRSLDPKQERQLSGAHEGLRDQVLPRPSGELPPPASPGGTTRPRGTRRGAG